MMLVASSANFPTSLPCLNTGAEVKKANARACSSTSLLALKLKICIVDGKSFWL